MSSSQQQSLSSGQSSSYKSTTVSITVHHQQENSNNEMDEDDGMTLISPNDDELSPTTTNIIPSSLQEHHHQPFTTLISKEKSLLQNKLGMEETNKHQLLKSSTTGSSTTTVNSTNNGSTIILLTSNNDEEQADSESHDDNEDQVEFECDQEINQITSSKPNSGGVGGVEVGGSVVDGKVIIISTGSGSSNLLASSPEPSGNLELVGLSKMMRQEVNDDGGSAAAPTEDEEEGGVEFEEFVLGGDDDVDLSFRVSTSSSSSSKMMKSSSKSVQQQSFVKSSSIQQQSSIEKVSSSSITKQSSQEQQVECSLSSSTASAISSSAAGEINQSNNNSAIQEQVTTMTNGSSDKIEDGGKKEGKKTKVERKTSKAGAGKKSKSNAEISKENISVTSITNGSTISSSINNHQHNNNIKPIMTHPYTQQSSVSSSSTSSSAASTTAASSDELVKKLGPGESRVFAKVCVANLRRSFGDLTAINGGAPTTTTAAAANNNDASSASNNLNNHNNDDGFNSLLLNKQYSSSSSLEYNRINNSNSHHGMSNMSNNINTNSLRDLKKSSFSKFDSLVSKNQQKEQQDGEGSKDNNGSVAGGKNRDPQQDSKPETKKMFCVSCEKQVFQMELVRAEKKDWHKNCFRCVTCRKVLGVDTYQSHEQRLYCKPHFKELFQPKKVAIEEDEDGGGGVDMNGEDSLVSASRANKKSKLQLIICESQPKELPPDVVRASDAPTTGLEDIQIDVRSKFEMFENLKEQKNSGGSKSPVEQGPVKRSASVLAKLKRYENSLGSGAAENGVSDEDLHGVDGIELQSDEDDGEFQLDGEEGPNSVIRDEIKRKLKNPLQAMNEIAHFKQMEQVRSKWEEGSVTQSQINAEVRKEELQKFRSRLCQGKSGQLKEMYEKGVETGGEGVTSARSEIEELKSEKAKAFREMFEKGEVGRRRFSGEDGEDVDGEGVGDEADGNCAGKRSNGVDLEVFEAGVAKESKRLFEELDKKHVSEMKEQKSGGNKGSASRFIERKQHSSSALVSGIQQQLVASGTSPPTDIVRSSDKKVEDVKANTEELSSKFKFFETYEDEIARKAKESKRETFKRITPPRDDRVVKTEKDYEDSDETYRDPTVVRHGEVTQEDPLQHSKTTSKMLSVFRQMEESLSKGDGGNPIIRPMKQFTPPRDTVGSGLRGNSDDDEEEEEEDEEEGEEDEEEEDTEDVEKRMSEDEFLKEVGSLARARSLRAKFERWEQQENERNRAQAGAVQDELAESIESAKNLKAKFEAMRLMGDVVGGNSNNKENLKGNSPVPIRVNRFVLNTTQNNHQHQESNTNPSSASTSPHLQLYCNNSFSSLPAGLSNNSNGHHQNNNNNMSSNEQCALCEKRVYVMEKIEAGGKMYHKNCFRCSQCKSILRMDTFTSNKGTLFCTTHFKQLFKIKGNYDEGFGHETQYAQWAKKHAGGAATAQPN